MHPPARRTTSSPPRLLPYPSLPYPRPQLQRQADAIVEHHERQQQQQPGRLVQVDLEVKAPSRRSYDIRTVGGKRDLLYQVMRLQDFVPPGLHGKLLTEKGDWSTGQEVGRYHQGTQFAQVLIQAFSHTWFLVCHRQCSRKRCIYHTTHSCLLNPACTADRPSPATTPPPHLPLPHHHRPRTPTPQAVSLLREYDPSGITGVLAEYAQLSHLATSYVEKFVGATHEASRWGARCRGSREGARDTGTWDGVREAGRREGAGGVVAGVGLGAAGASGTPPLGLHVSKAACLVLGRRGLRTRRCGTP